MSQAPFENLSALADGELTREEIRFMLRRTERDASLRDAWGRYHVIRAGMRQEVSMLADDDFAERVMAQVGATSAQPRGARGHHWLRWSAGGAIAASVAAAALIIVQPQMRPAPMTAANDGARVAAAQPVATATQPMQAPTVPRWLSTSPSAAQMAQPAAASFYVGNPGHRLESHSYARHLNPYMTLPGYRAPTTRQARQVMYQLWSMTPRHASSSRAARVQAQ